MELRNVRRKYAKDCGPTHGNWQYILQSVCSIVERRIALQWCPGSRDGVCHFQGPKRFTPYVMYMLWMRFKSAIHFKDCLSIHCDHAAQALHGVDDLLPVVLRHPLLHDLGRALDKLLTVDQAEPQHAFDLLDDLGLGGCVERGERQGEERFFLRGGRGFFLFSGRRGTAGSTSSGAGSKAADRHVGDVEASLQASF